jgi:hypothetical protein
MHKPKARQRGGYLQILLGEQPFWPGKEDLRQKPVPQHVTGYQFGGNIAWIVLERQVEG